MRSGVLVFVVVACGGNGVHRLGDGGADAPAPADASQMIDAPMLDAGNGGSGSGSDSGSGSGSGSGIGSGSACVSCGQVAGSLTGLSWQLPCTSSGSPACGTTATSQMMATVGGTTGVTYDITVELRGVVEQKTYDTGCKNGFLDSGPASTGDSFNVYSLTISSPLQTFYVNNGASGI